MDTDPPHIAGGVILTETQMKARRQRNVVIGIVIALLCALFYVVTVVKLGAGVVRGH